jgi:hypothetical protein
MKNITMIQSTTISTRISSIPTTVSRNGNGVFCSDFTGRNSITDTGYGDITDW